jgi:hypothetical protein
MKSIIGAALAVCRNASTAFLAVLSITAALAAQRPASPAGSLPPLSMTCPMHPDVVESRPGSCPLCKMSLVPVRLDTAHMCPVHTTVMSDAAGTCRLCRRQMMPVTVSVTWTCMNQPAIDRIDPGACPDGSAMIRRRSLRPHGNHNPQHGGQFFMAPDSWHHLEGTLPRERTFRLYLYDDFARPLPAAEMKRVQARVVTRETYDAATRKTTEITAFPLRASRDGTFMEARVDAAKLPVELTAKVRFKADAPEYRFDFTFAGLSKAPPSATGPVSATGGKPVTPAPRVSTPAGERASMPVAPSPASAVEPALVATPIPDSIAGILEQLTLRDANVRELIEQGNFAAVWVPAFQAKDLAIALEPQLAHLSPRARADAEPAVQRVVRMAWLLDAFGDVGNRQQVESAYAAFTSAVAETTKAFAEVR